MNPNGLIDQILSGLGGGVPGGSDGRKDGTGSGFSFPGGVGGAAAAAGIAGLLLGSKKGRKTIGKAAKYGGVAVLGGLAYRAWQQHQAGQSGPDLPPSPASDIWKRPVVNSILIPFGLFLGSVPLWVRPRPGGQRGPDPPPQDLPDRSPEATGG